MLEDVNGIHVTNKVCLERRESLKLEASAKAEAIKLATVHSDESIVFISKRIDTMDSRINNLILLILGQLVAFIFGLLILIVSGKV